MVASITALGRFDKSGNSFDGSYFTKQQSAEYWNKGGERSGEWFGEGAQVLKLKGGPIDPKILANLLAGYSPDGQRRLVGTRSQRFQAGQCTKKPHRERCPGFDLCFSADKTLSICEALSPPERSRIYQECGLEAAKMTLRYAERELPLGRRGLGGTSQERVKLVVAIFPHSVARPTKDGEYQPQLHWHCVIVNACLRQDGTWRAVNGEFLHRWTRTLGPIFRANFAHLLNEKLGLQLAKPHDKQGRLRPSFQAAGVPEALCKRWSSRRNEIDQLMEGSTQAAKNGKLSQSTAAARERANLLSRRAKLNIPPHRELRAEWNKVAAEYRFGPKEVEKLVGKSRRPSPEKVFRKAYQSALKTITADTAHFTYRRVLQAVCEHAQHFAVSGTWLTQRVRQELEHSPKIIALNSVNQEKQYTTKANWKLEEKLLAETSRLRSRQGAVVSQKTVERTLKQYPKLNNEQTQALRKLLTEDKTAIRVLHGPAGTGKGILTEAVAAALKAEGYRPIGGALASVASEGLANAAKIPSRTVASYLYQLDPTPLESVKRHVQHDLRQLVRAARGKPTYARHRMHLNSRDALIIDEAAMLNNEDFYRLCRVARKANCTILFMGDKRQLPPIGPGAPMSHLLKNLDHARLSRNMRQQDPADRQAVTALREGKADEAISNYDRRDRVVVGKDRRETVEQLVRTWAASGGVTKPEEHLIFTNTRQEAQVVNQLCQAERQKAGTIDASRRIAVGNGFLYEGDRVLFQKNVYEYGIRNGFRGKIISVNPMLGRITVELEPSAGTGRHAQADNRQVVVRIKDFGQEGITPSYSITTHRGQGQTVAHSYLLMGGSMTNREMVYTQATRGKLTTRLFVDELHAGEQFQDLARQIERSAAKQMAHDIGKPKQGPHLGL